MSSIVWIIAMNGLIGIIILFPIFIVFIVAHCEKYGEDIVDDAIESITIQSNDTYDAIGYPLILKAISATLTVFLWQIFLTKSMQIIHQTIVDLYNTRNRP